jgi:HEAT repeat protein
MTSTPQSAPRTPDDALPLVEPPSAGFIVQLFLVPAIIVAIIVAVWLAFNWLAQGGGDPYEYLKALERNNATVRWQAAHHLASALARPNNRDLRADRVVAGRLAEILDHDVDAGRLDEDSVKLRWYLCTALGQFERPEIVLPVLLKTADTRRDAKEDEIRFAALRAIKSIAEQKSFKPAEHPEVLAALTKTASDAEPIIRSTSAFALGAIGNDEARTALERLLKDPYPDVRYNAATMLCHLGDVSAVPVIVEMLDPTELRGVEAESEAGSREVKRAAIVDGALAAIGELATNNRTADLSALRGALERLRAAEIPKSITLKVDDTLHQLSQRAALKP